MTSVPTAHDTGQQPGSATRPADDPITAADRYVAEIDREPCAGLDPRQLAALMKTEFRRHRAEPGADAVDARWVTVAHAVIAYVRQHGRGPMNVAGGGVSVASPPAPVAPASGGSTAVTA